MAAYITTDYFIGQILIPNLTNTSHVGEALVEEVERYIAIYEPKFMEALLGEELYNKFVDAIENETPLDDRWQDLYDAIYDEENFRSPAANYVWYIFQRDNAIARLGQGDGQVKGNNFAMTVNPHRFAEVWNEMVDMIEDIDDLIVGAPDDYQYYDPDGDYRKRINAFGI